MLKQVHIKNMQDLFPKETSDFHFMQTNEPFRVLRSRLERDKPCLGYKFPFQEVVKPKNSDYWEKFRLIFGRKFYQK